MIYIKASAMADLVFAAGLQQLLQAGVGEVIAQIFDLPCELTGTGWRRD